MRKTCSYKAFFSFHGRVQADTGREHILLTKKVEKSTVLLDGVSLPIVRLADRQ